MLDVAQKRQKREEKKESAFSTNFFFFFFRTECAGAVAHRGRYFPFSSSDGASSCGCTVRSPSFVSREECEIFPCPGATETQ